MNSLSELRQLFESALRDWQVPAQPDNLYQPVRYILELGGKRMRPVLALLGASACGGNPRDALGAAMAVEWFHNFSLLHDDIMDKAELRRGKPTVHRKFSTNAAILSGDVMLVQAFQFLAKDHKAPLEEILDQFSQTAVAVCEGQQMDMDFEQRDQVSEAEYLEMIRLKTAVLLGCSLYLGARQAAAPQTQAASLYRFGEQLGISFQLQDDWLDTFGEPEKVGKMPGGDIMQDKQTCLMIYARQQASAEDQRLLDHWKGRKGDGQADSLSEKVQVIREIYHRSGADVATRDIAEKYYHLALKSLEEAALPQAGTAMLREMADSLLGRAY